MHLQSSRNRIIFRQATALLFSLAAAFTFLLFVPTPASAQSDPQRVAIGHDLTISEGEIVQGDVSVTNGNLTLLGEVRGNVAVVNGSATLDGKVSGDVAVTNGNLILHPHSQVNGNVLSLMGTITRDPAAKVNGKLTRLDNPIQSASDMSPQPGSPSWLQGGAPLAFRNSLNRLTGFFGWGMFSLLLLTLAVGLAYLLPRRVRVASSTLEAEVGPSVVVGSITALLLGPIAALLAVILVATVIGVILLPILFIAVGLALLSGLVVVSVWLGNHIYETARHTPSHESAPLPLQVLLGMAVILGSTAVPSMLVPGWPAALLLPLLYLVACIGIGSTILSRFGTLLPPNARRTT